MDSKKIRTIVVVAIFAIMAIGLIAGIQFGTLSGFGWDTFSAICPIGAFTTMLATHTLLPRGVISLIIMIALILIVGRAFCSWVCPVPVMQRIGNFFKRKSVKKAEDDARAKELRDIATYELSCGKKCATCGGCKQEHPKLDSRHAILGGALASTLIFGFPVFCLVCPIGLSFATIILVWRLFGAGDITWSVILVPALLIFELVFFRKWCGRICPIGAFQNLFSRFARPFRPQIDDSKCIETVSGKACSKCAIVCDADINLRHPAFGEHTLDDCTRCRACVDVCPTKAVSMPFISKKGASGAPVMQVADPLAGVKEGK